MYALSLDTSPRAATATCRVLCLHSSASSGSQWRALAGDWDNAEINTPDLLGYGSGAYRAGKKPLLERELEALAGALDTGGPALHVVGHSYGAALALRLACRYPQRIASLCLYEPVLFSVLFAAASPSASEAWQLGAGVRQRVQAGCNGEAAAFFIDYWNGAGAWQALPEPRRRRVENQMPKIADEFAALFLEPCAAEDLASLTMPLLLMYGGRSPQPTRDICTITAGLLPSATVRRFDELGHMGPLQAPEVVNPVMSAFIADAAALQWQPSAIAHCDTSAPAGRGRCPAAARRPG